jgi:hypothetical protein
MDPGHQAMKNDRFWTGLALLMTPLALFALCHSVQWLLPVASVEGRITRDGHPLAGGTICFASLDREQSGDMIGQISADGYFTCCPRWWVPSGNLARYEIFVYPTPGPSPRSDGSGPDETVILRTPREGVPNTPRPIVRPRSVADSALPSTSIAANHPALRSIGGREAGGSRPVPVEISLGAEQVHIDINLGG